VVSAGAVLPQDKWAAEGLSSGHADLPKFRFEIDDVDPSWPGGIYPGDPPRRSPAAKYRASIYEFRVVSGDATNARLRRAAPHSIAPRNVSSAGGDWKSRPPRRGDRP
jgi:hypothetical protein